MLYKLLGIIGWRNLEKSYPLCKCDKGEGIRCELGIRDDDDNNGDTNNDDDGDEHECQFISDDEQRKLYENANLY